MFMNHLWKEDTFYNQLRDNGYDLIITFPAPAEIKIKISNSFLKQEHEEIIALKVNQIPQENDDPYDHHELKEYTDKEIADLIEAKLKYMISFLYHISLITCIHLMSEMENLELPEGAKTDILYSEENLAKALIKISAERKDHNQIDWHLMKVTTS